MRKNCRPKSIHACPFVRWWITLWPEHSPSRSPGLFCWSVVLSRTWSLWNVLVWLRGCRAVKGKHWLQQWAAQKNVGGVLADECLTFQQQKTCCHLFKCEVVSSSRHKERPSAALCAYSVTEKVNVSVLFTCKKNENSLVSCCLPVLFFLWQLHYFQAMFDLCFFQAANVTFLLIDLWC